MQEARTYRIGFSRTKNARKLQSILKGNVPTSGTNIRHLLEKSTNDGLNRSVLDMGEKEILIAICGSKKVCNGLTNKDCQLLQQACAPKHCLHWLHGPRFLWTMVNFQAATKHHPCLMSIYSR